MRAHIDIGEVEARTKIRAKYLRAIENEEWDLLPGPVYVKSFLRTYGDYLGLDSRLLIDEYKRRYERPADHDSHPIAAIIRERERDARGPLMPSWVIVVAVLAVVVVALFVVGKLATNITATTTSSVSTTTAERHHGAHKPKRPSHTVTLPTTTPTTTTHAVATLKLVPTASVYVCVVDGSGHTLIRGLDYSVGDTIPEQTASKLLITLGNASVHMVANGKPYTVTPETNAIFLEVQPTGVTTTKTGPTCQ